MLNKSMCQKIGPKWIYCPQSSQDKCHKKQIRNNEHEKKRKNEHLNQQNCKKSW